MVANTSGRKESGIGFIIFSGFIIGAIVFLFIKMDKVTKEAYSPCQGVAAQKYTDCILSDGLNCSTKRDIWFRQCYDKEPQP